MLLEIAIGDAYGAGFEYASELIEEYNNLAGYVKHPRHDIGAGYYTDDTQMSLAIAEVIVSGQPWTRENLAESFVRAFKRDPHEGYAGGFQAFLKKVQSGQQFLVEIRGDSDKSGAAMRACPVGIFPTIIEVLEKSTIQASLTHNSPAGIAAANAASLMTHYFLYNLGPKVELGRFLDRHIPGYKWAIPWNGEVKSKGWMSVRAAITAIMRNSRLSDLLKDCISFGGDVDTVATIALGAVSATPEIEQDLPEVLVNGLENGRYGRDYLIELDQKLLALKK